MGMGTRTDGEILGEIGQRLRAYRLQQDVSQRDLALRAGVSLRTLQNAEGGGDTRISTLVRVLRALGRLDSIDAFLPEPRVSPMLLLETQGRGRQRAGAGGRKRG